MNTVSFNKAASAIVKALAMQDKAAVKGGQLIETTFIQYLDSCTLAGVTRDQAGVDAIGKEILGCQVMVDAIAIYGPVFKTTVSSYAGGAKRAYYWDAQWYASAHLSPEKGGMEYLPWGKGAKAAKARSGKVSVTTDAELMLTIRKAIEQAFLLNRDVLKSILIDAACEIDPDFKV